MSRHSLPALSVSLRSSAIACLSLTLLLPGGVVGASHEMPVEASPPPGASRTAATASPEPAASGVETAGDIFEPDFSVGDWELHRIPWQERWFNGLPPIPPNTVGPSDEKGVPMRPLGPGGSLVYNPTVLAQQGLKHLDAYQRTGKAVHRRAARNIARVLDRIATKGRQRRWQPHLYDYGEQKKGWVNANSHGLVLSFFSRYHALFGAGQKLGAAQLLLRSFERREDNERWFATVTPAGLLWLEHWPNGKHVHTLNAHLNAMFGLYDYWLETGDAMAKAYFLGGAYTVRQKLHRFRRKGRLSRYSLSSDLATVHYHETHIGQLRVLSEITGDKWFARQADLLERDERKWRANGKGRD